MSQVLIRPASTAEAGPVAELLAQAFSKDPSVEAMLGSGDHVTAQFAELLALQLRTQYLPHGVVEVAADGADLLGAAVWSRPDAGGSALTQLRLLAGSLRILGQRFPTAMRVELQSVRMHPRFPHWYLYLLGVSPLAQGRGVGGQLLDHRLARLGDDPAYLEASTAGSARLYRRHGFVRLGEVPMGATGSLLGMWLPGRVPN